MTNDMITQIPQSKRNLATCLLAGGGSLAILSQITQAALPLDSRRETLILMFIGLAAFLLGIFAAREERVVPWLESSLQKPVKWLQLETWQFVALFLALCFAVLTHFAAGYSPLVVSPFAAWMAWLIGISYCLMGCWNATGFSLRANWKVIALALGFAVLALPFRAIATNEIPIILMGDEASAGIYGREILEGEANNPFAAGWYAFPGLYFFIPAASISLLGSTTAALRIPSAIAGALTVGGVYLAGRAMFGKRAGILAAITLAGFHFHIHFSRIGLNNIWDGLFFVLTVGAVWYAWEKEDRNAYILTGLGIGLSQYFYPSSRALLAVVFGGIMISGVFDPQRLKRAAKNILLMIIVAVVVFLPLAWYYIRHPAQYFAPLERVSILGEWMENEILITGLPAWRILLKQLLLGIQAFTYIPLQHWYRPEVPLMRAWYAGFFLLGLVYLISRPKESRSIFLFVWLGIYILLGGLSESTPASQRYVAAAPLCALILVHGLSETAILIERMWQRSHRYTTAAILAIAILIAAEDVNFYFNKYTPHTYLALSGGPGEIAQEISNDLLEKPQGTQAFFFKNSVMGYYSIPSIPYLVPQVTGFDVEHPWGSPDNPTPSSNHLIFIFLPDNMADLSLIQTEYPGGTLSEKIGANGDTLYWLYEYIDA